MVRLTARARLASLQTALVLAAGAALTGLTYLLMRRRVIFTHLDPLGTPSPGTSPQDGLLALADRVQADTLSALLPQAALALVVVTGLAAVLSWLVAGRVLRPIRVISAARRLSAENLTERVPATTPADELSALAPDESPRTTSRSSKRFHLTHNAEQRPPSPTRIAFRP
nr:hypothetical protein [Nonomuraea sp. NEAU-A123]